MVRRTALRLRPLVAFLAASLLLVAPPVARPAAAAEELRLTANATYALDAEGGAVRVTIDITATNLTPNTVSGNVVRSYYWDELGFGIHEEAADVRATGSGRGLAVSTEAEDGYRGLTVRLANRLTYRETQRLRIQYDLPGGEPRSESRIRVGKAFASFYAWAWGDPGRSAVTIRLPRGFDPTVNGADLEESTADDGSVVLRAEAIDAPQEWFATVDAERPRMLVRDPLVLMAGARITIRGWPEDAEWRQKVHDLMEDGLPILHGHVGLDWPVAGELGVYEVHTPLLEGYAGVYYTDRDRIEIGEDLDDLTIIHEAAHAWFNGDLFTDRWITEGFADEYAWQVLDELELRAPGPPRIERGDRASVALNAWTHPGRIDDEETDAREAYGYAASWTVLRALVDEIGIERMREVIAAADDSRTAYRGAGDPEAVARRDDWRRFLDLLEEVGKAEEAEALFREWVVEDDEQEALLDERAEAREAYRELVEAGDGWEAPWSVRSKLGAWDFDRVEPAIDEALEVLDARDELDTLATSLGVDRTDRLETAYEAAQIDLDDAAAIAAEEAASLDALEAAKATLDRERDLLTSLGLWNEPAPEDRYAAALAAFEADEHGQVIEAASAAGATIDGAAEIGRSRATTAGIAGGGTVLAGGTLLLVVRRRRGARATLAAEFAPAAVAADRPADDGGPQPP